MKRVDIKALSGFSFLMLVMGALLFLPAGTFGYWQAWVFLGVFGGSSLAITLYLMKKDPALLERRIQAGPAAEKEWRQKVIQSFTSLTFIALLVVPALDHRRRWSAVPLCGVIAGDVLVALGFLVIFFVYRENSFASATVKVYPGQKVISTGLYAFVRHPMYLGALLMLAGMPPALGSWWGLAVFPVFIPVFLERIFDEEELLTKNLPGYAEYKKKVRCRLLPFVW